MVLRRNVVGVEPDEREAIGRRRSTDTSKRTGRERVESLPPQRDREGLLDHVHESQRDQLESLAQTDLAEELGGSKRPEPQVFVEPKTLGFCVKPEVVELETLGFCIKPQVPATPSPSADLKIMKVPPLIKPQC